MIIFVYNFFLIYNNKMKMKMVVKQRGKERKKDF